MTTIHDVDFAVEMISVVESKAPVWTYEFMELVKAVTEFRNFFRSVQTKYDLPADLLDELDGYISLLPSEEKPLKYMDVVRAKDQNNLVEALRIIGDLVTKLEIKPYEEGEYISRTLKIYYPAYYSGYLNEFCQARKAYVVSYATVRFYCYRYYADVPALASLELWFKVDKELKRVKVRIKADAYTAKDGEPFINVYFVSSGEPAPLEFIPAPVRCMGRKSIEDRTDVSIASTVSLNYQSGKINYDEIIETDVYATCPYVVLAIRDRFIEEDVNVYLRKLTLAPA